MNVPQAAAPTRLDGETRLYVIIGDPIGQVKSPANLTRILQERGANAVLVPGNIKPEGVDAFMAGAVACLNMDGVIATIPHKQALLKHCGRVTKRATVAGAVNITRREGNAWIGDNTDGQGHVDAVLAEGGAVEGSRALLVGAGGAGSAIAYEFLDRGVKFLGVHDVDQSRRDGLIARLQEVFGDRVGAGSNDPAGYDIIANATPLGMREGDPFPVDMEKLTAEQFCSCVITKPDPSPFIVAAREKGCKTSTGVDMFNAQAGFIVDYLLNRV
ncbi:MAG: shikimate dehydrogenase [Nitratireductor sp.]|nr:shikimate dehydrogenase [Nitratireductor sp.]